MSQTDSFANASRFGVLSTGLPCAPRSPKPWSSVMTMRTFGRSASQERRWQEQQDGGSDPAHGAPRDGDEWAWRPPLDCNHAPVAPLSSAPAARAAARSATRPRRPGRRISPLATPSGDSRSSSGRSPTLSRAAQHVPAHQADSGADEGVLRGGVHVCPRRRRCTCGRVHVSRCSRRTADVRRFVPPILAKDMHLGPLVTVGGPRVPLHAVALREQYAGSPAASSTSSTPNRSARLRSAMRCGRFSSSAGSADCWPWRWRSRSARGWSAVSATSTPARGLIAAGDFRPMPVPAVNDELRDLNEAVNEMAHRLAAFQDELQRSERLRVLGQLSGGLAHQLRNAATGAKLAVEVYLQENPNTDPEPLAGRTAPARPDRVQPAAVPRPRQTAGGRQAALRPRAPDRPGGKPDEAAGAARGNHARVEAAGGAVRDRGRSRAAGPPRRQPDRQRGRGRGTGRKRRGRPDVACDGWP